MKKSISFILCAFLVLTSFSLCSCNESSDKVSIVISDNISNGTLSLNKNISDYKIGDELSIVPHSDVGYKTDKILINNEVLESPYKFICDKNYYYIDASFILDYGETLITLTGNTIIGVGEEFQMNYEVYGPSKTLIWTSSNDLIATVDEYGVVKGLSYGFVEITATSFFDPSISTSWPLFVSPNYVINMVDTYSNYNYKNGVSFNLETNVSLDLSGTKIDILLPITFEIQIPTLNEEDIISQISKTNWHLKIDFSQLNETKVLGILPIGTVILTLISSQLLPKIAPTRDPNNFSNAQSIDFYYFGDGNIHAAIFNKSSNDTLYVSEYEINTVSSVVATIVSLVLDNFVNSDLQDVDLENFSIDDLNTFLNFSSNPVEGISLTEETINALNDFYKQNIDSLLFKDEDGDGQPDLENAEAIKALLPESFKDIRLSFIENNGVLQHLQLTVIAYKNEQNNDFYTLMSSKLSKYEELSPNYFDNIPEYLLTSNKAYKDTLNILNLNNELSIIRPAFDNSQTASKNSYYVDKLTNMWSEYFKLSDLSKDIISSSLSKLKKPLISITPLINDEISSFITTDQGLTIDIKPGDKVRFLCNFYGFTPGEGASIDYSISLSLKPYISFNETTKEITIKSAPIIPGKFNVTVSGKNLSSGIDSETLQIYFNITK